MKQFEVIWTKNAQFDLESIIEYIKSWYIAKIDSLECNLMIYFPQRKILSYNKLVFQNREVSMKRWKLIFKIDSTSLHLLVVDSRKKSEIYYFQDWLTRNKRKFWMKSIIYTFIVLAVL